MQYVDLSEHGFVLEPRYYFYGWSSSPKIMGRASLVDALVCARSHLPNGFNFKIWDVKRRRRTQTLMRNSFRRRLRMAYPERSRSEIESLVTQFGAKLPNPNRMPRWDTHLWGGAIDLTIVDPDRNELYMGTDHDDLTPKAALDYYENHSSLSRLDREAKRNRRLLKRVMLGAHFKPYSIEWWHWSFEY